MFESSLEPHRTSGFILVHDTHCSMRKRCRTLHAVTIAEPMRRQVIYCALGHADLSLSVAATHALSHYIASIPTSSACLGQLFGAAQPPFHSPKPRTNGAALKPRGTRFLSYPHLALASHMPQRCLCGWESRFHPYRLHLSGVSFQHLPSHLVVWGQGERHGAGLVRATLWMR